MCIICVHIQKEKMTADEGYRALGEMCETLEPEHVEEVEDLLFDKMLEELLFIEDDDPAYEQAGIDFRAFSDQSVEKKYKPLKKQLLTV